MRRIIGPLVTFVTVGVLSLPTGVAQAQVQAPDTAAARPYLRQMQSDLRNLVVAQEAYFADNDAYAPSIPAMGGSFIPSRGVSIAILALTETGWNGVAVHQSAPGYVCGIFVGMDDTEAPLRGEVVEGQPSCKGPDGKPVG